MENQDFKIGIKTVWVLVIGNLLVTGFVAFALIQNLEFAQILLMFGLVLFFSTWIIVLSDVVKSKIYNKAFWVITMFILPSIAPIFYMVRRSRLSRIG